MKTGRYLVVLSVLIQVVLHTTLARADLANPIEIVNGAPMSFTTSTNDNWYSFTLVRDDTVMLLGSDSAGGAVNNFRIYDESVTEVYSEAILTTTTDLSSGNYFINVSDTRSGSFSIYSENINNPVEINPVLGSIVNPYLLENGVALPFDNETATNVYFFEMDASGDIQISGSDSAGGAINNVKIYNESKVLVFGEAVYSVTIGLSTGTYNLIISETRSGNISVYSPVLNPEPDPPLPAYIEGYNAGKQQCTDDPGKSGDSLEWH